MQADQAPRQKLRVVGFGVKTSIQDSLPYSVDEPMT